MSGVKFTVGRNMLGCAVDMAVQCDDTIRYDRRV